MSRKKRFRGPPELGNSRTLSRKARLQTANLICQRIFEKTEIVHFAKFQDAYSVHNLFSREVTDTRPAPNESPCNSSCFYQSFIQSYQRNPEHKSRETFFAQLFMDPGFRQQRLSAILLFEYKTIRHLLYESLAQRVPPAVTWLKFYRWL